MGTRIAVYWDDGAPARVVLFIDSFLVALFRLDVFVEVATLTNTESIHKSSACVTIVSGASSIQQE
jgi:hypothetical protein